MRPISATRADVATASPAVRGSENGLELAWWVVTADSATLARELAPWLDEPVPADAAAVRAWAANGLRLVSVPVEKLETLRSRLPIVGAIQRQWMGQVPLWTDAVKGPYWPSGATVGLDTGPLRLGPGRLRLLTRCWTAPVPPAQEGPAGRTAGLREKHVVHAVLHVELLPQHQETEGNPGQQDLLKLPTASLGPEEEGLVFRRLALTIEAPPGWAYLIIPESPDVDWKAAGNLPAAPEAGVAGKADGATADPGAPASPPIGRVKREKPGAEPPVASPVLESPEPAGPPAPVLMTLGQAMLTSVGARGGAKPGDKGRPSRAIVILVPRVPEEFRLLR
jgi:hypothetical protein